MLYELSLVYKIFSKGVNFCSHKKRVFFLPNCLRKQEFRVEKFRRFIWWNIEQYVQLFLGERKNSAEKIMNHMGCSLFGLEGDH